MTNLKIRNARVLYEEIYCRRGEAENHIKSWKTHLVADRTSCSKAAANLFRLFLHAAAYWLLWSLRALMPKRSMWRAAQFDTLRLRLIKVAVRVVEMKTQIRLHLPTAFPAQHILRLARTAIGWPSKCRSFCLLGRSESSGGHSGLARDRPDIGHHPRRRDWRLQARCQSTPPHGLFGIEAERTLLRRENSARRHHQGTQQTGKTRASRGRLDLPSAGADWSRYSQAQRNSAAGDHGHRLEGAGPPLRQISPARSGWQTHQCRLCRRQRSITFASRLNALDSQNASTISATAKATSTSCIS